MIWRRAVQKVCASIWNGFPSVEDCIESFLRLLENIHPKEEIAAYIEEGIQYSGM